MSDLIEATDSSVDAIRLVTPGVKVVEIDATGLSIRLPYDAPGADPGAGYERVLAAEIAGDFSAIMGHATPGLGADRRRDVGDDAQ